MRLDSTTLELAAMILFFPVIMSAEVTGTPACPMQIDSLKSTASPVSAGMLIAGHTETEGRISFRYTNVSGRDVKSITLRLSGRMQVSGPGGPSFLETTQTLDVEGPMLANTSKKMTVKLPEGTRPVVHADLLQVRFVDGELWENDSKLNCVSNTNKGKRR